MGTEVMAIKDMVMAQVMETVIIVILMVAATIITVIGILMDIKNLGMTGMTIAMDQGMVPVFGDETRRRPLPMGYNSSPLAKSSIWSSLNFSLVGKPLSDQPRIE